MIRNRWTICLSDFLLPLISTIQLKLQELYIITMLFNYTFYRYLWTKLRLRFVSTFQRYWLAETNYFHWPVKWWGIAATSTPKAIPGGVFCSPISIFIFLPRPLFLYIQYIISPVISLLLLYAVFWFFIFYATLPSSFPSPYNAKWFTIYIKKYNQIGVHSIRVQIHFDSSNCFSGGGLSLFFSFFIIARARKKKKKDSLFCISFLVQIKLL